MSDKRVSAYGKKVSEVGKMSFINDALKDARFWAEELQNAEFKGLGDTREAARSCREKDWRIGKLSQTAPVQMP